MSVQAGSAQGGGSTQVSITLGSGDYVNAGIEGLRLVSQAKMEASRPGSSNPRPGDAEVQLHEASWPAPPRA